MKWNLPKHFTVIHCMCALKAHVHSYASDEFCLPLFHYVYRRGAMLCTWLQPVVTSVQSITWDPRWSPCSTAWTTVEPPCCIGQLWVAMLKWCGMSLMNSSWTSLFVTKWVCCACIDMCSKVFVAVVLVCAWENAAADSIYIVAECTNMEVRSSSLKW